MPIELNDVEQFRMAHPAAHPAKAGHHRANGDGYWLNSTSCGHLFIGLSHRKRELAGRLLFSLC
jgi:hypothetical protein